MPINPLSISSRATRVGALLLLVMILGGCFKSKVPGPRTAHLDRVAINDFVDPVSPQSPDQSPVEPIGGGETVTAGHDGSAGLGDGLTLAPTQTDDSSTQVPRQNSSPAGALPEGALTLLEAKVGDVNGKPIFTNSFFAPIEERLIAESARLTPENWRRSAGGIIANRLDGIIADELLRAEALTSLTPTQRVGLQAFLNNFRNNLLSENLGSSQLARRRIKQQEGVTLDEALKQKEVDTLVQLTLIQEVNRRVSVSWRDIKQRYERDIDEFSPPPTAVFRVIRAFNDDKDTVAEIQSQLDAGVDFLKVAAGPLNNFNTDTAGMHTTVIEGTYETTKFFGPAALNEQTQQLKIGDSAGPIELGSSIYWIKLMDIVQESTSLYDAQLQIQRELTFERRTSARNEYLGRLMERARVSSRDEVLLRLLQIAEQRYGRQG